MKLRMAQKEKINGNTSSSNWRVTRVNVLECYISPPASVVTSQIHSLLQCSLNELKV